MLTMTIGQHELWNELIAHYFGASAQKVCKVNLSSNEPNLLFSEYSAKKHCSKHMAVGVLLA